MQPATQKEQNEIDANDVLTPLEFEKKNIEEKAMLAIENPVENGEDLNSWRAVSSGMNRLLNVSYLLGNILVFGFYLCPLLYRIIMHSRVGYLTREPDNLKRLA